MFVLVCMYATQSVCGYNFDSPNCSQAEPASARPMSSGSRGGALYLGVIQELLWVSALSELLKG